MTEVGRNVAQGNLPSTEHGAEAYDAIWKRYAPLDAASPAAFHRRRCVVRLIRRLSPAPTRLIDIGCGPGLLLARLQAEFPNVQLVGADFSPESLKLARARVSGIETQELDLMASDFSTKQASHLGRYDVVVCSEVLEHLPNEGRALEHLGQLTKPGGYCVLTVPGGKMSRFDKLIGHQRHYSAVGLSSQLRAAGFSDIEVWAWGFPFHNLYRSAVRAAARWRFSESPGNHHAPDVGHGFLGQAYRAFGATLKPLYYLNAPFWGEQLVAQGRRRE